MSDSLQPHEPHLARPPCPSPTPGVYPNPCPSSQWCYPTISSSVVPFSSCPQSFPASGSFQMSQLFASGGQSIGVSASTSVFPMNIQDWFPRMDWLDLLAVQGTLKSLLQHHSSLIPKMSTFSLAISCLTTSNLPWFMDLTVQVPMQYCSLQHRTLLLSPVPPTTGCCFCFGSIPSFFLELFLHWSPVAYWAPTDLGSSSFSVLSFWLVILLTGFSRQEYWSGLPFPSPVDNILSDCSPWPIHLGWPHVLSLKGRKSYHLQQYGWT